VNRIFDLRRRLAAEAGGTAVLVATVVGSGIMGERMAEGNMAVALLGNTIATGVALVVLILIFGPISGCHINPAVTLTFLIKRDIAPSLAVLYVIVQLGGAMAGVMLAHLMFDLAPVLPSPTVRTGIGQWTGEVAATFGLVMTILGCLRFRPEVVPFAVGLYITAGYWFTSSTSFANPAVTVARSFTNTFSGIRPADAPWFILAQLAGAILATALAGWLFVDRDAEHADSAPLKASSVED